MGEQKKYRSTADMSVNTLIVASLLEDTNMLRQALQRLAQERSPYFKWVAAFYVTCWPFYWWPTTDLFLTDFQDMVGGTMAFALRNQRILELQEEAKKKIKIVYRCK